MVIVNCVVSGSCIGVCSYHIPSLQKILGDGLTQNTSFNVIAWTRKLDRPSAVGFVILGNSLIFPKLPSTTSSVTTASETPEVQ